MADKLYGPEPSTEKTDYIRGSLELRKRGSMLARLKPRERLKLKKKRNEPE